MFTNYSITSKDIQAIRNMTKFERDELLAKINGYNPANFLEPISGKSNEYYCPCCDNGTGETASGIVPTYSGGKYIYGCRKGGGDCNFNGDLIAIIGKCNNLDWRGNGLFEILAIGRQFIGNNAFSSTAKTRELKQAKPAKDSAEAIAAAQKILNSAQANIDNIPTEYRRGLTLETLKHFGCGYLPNYQPKSTAPKYPALIIPAGNSYVAVAVERKNLDAVYFKRFAYNVSTSSFGLDFITSSGVNLIVEGAVDAMSIWQATGGKVPVVATHSADGYRRFLKEIDAKSIVAKFVIMFDSDDVGRDTAKTFETKLNKNPNCKAVAKFLSSDISGIDANAILINEGEKILREKIEEIIDSAQIELDEMVASKSARHKNRDENAEKVSTYIELFGTHSTAAAIDNCPLDLVVPTDLFLFSKTNGIFAFHTSGKTRKLIQVAHNAFIPTAVYVGGDDESSVTELSVYDKLENRWHKHTIETAAFVDTSRIIELVNFGIDLTPQGKGYAGDYVMLLRNFRDNLYKIPVNKLYSQTGWQGSHFIYPNRRDNELVFGNGFNYKVAFAAEGERAEFFLQLQKTAELNPVARLTIAAALAAPMLKLCKVRNFTVNLVGRTGNGKSALQDIAAAIYGNPREIMTSFNSTTMAITSHSDALNDLPNIVDEFQTADAKIRESVEKMLYDIALGKGRARCNRNGDLKPVEQFRTVTILSAEQSILPDDAGGGAMNRVLELNCPRIDNDTAVKLHHFAETHYGIVGMEWIEYLEKHFADNDYLAKVTEYKFSMRVYKDVFKDLSDQHLTILAVMMLALIEFDRAFKDTVNFELNLALDTADIVELLAKIAQDIPTAKQVQNSARAITAIEDFVQSYPSAFLDLKEVYSYNDEKIVENMFTGRRERYGYIFENGDVLILKPAIKEALKGFPSTKAIIQQFAEEGLIQFNQSAVKKRFYQNAKKINGKTIWGYYFPRLIEVAGGDEGDNTDN